MTSYYLFDKTAKSTSGDGKDGGFGGSTLKARAADIIFPFAKVFIEFLLLFKNT